MRTLALAIVVASQAMLIGAPPENDTVTYQVTNGGGYNFYNKDGKRVAYSKVVRRRKTVKQTLYVCRDPKLGIKKDVAVLEYPGAGSEDMVLDVRKVLLERVGLSEKRVMIVLARKAKLGDKGPVPPEPAEPALLPPQPKVNVVAVKITRDKNGSGTVLLQSGQTLTYFPNKIGGYMFKHDGVTMLFSTIFVDYRNTDPQSFHLDNGGQYVWGETDQPAREMVLLGELHRSKPNDIGFSRRRFYGQNFEAILQQVEPILENRVPLAPPDPTKEDRWKAILGKP